jgi:transposase
MILLVSDARAQWVELDRRITAFDAEFVCWAKENEEARRLTTIPGIGAIVTSALVAAVGRAESFDRGRDLAAWLGLVPRQLTTGGKSKLLGISKRGNKYLRCPTLPSTTRIGSMGETVSCAARTAQAILASLLAKATTATLRRVLPISSSAKASVAA